MNKRLIKKENSDIPMPIWMHGAEEKIDNNNISDVTYFSTFTMNSFNQPMNYMEWNLLEQNNVDYNSNVTHNNKRLKRLTFF